MRNLILFLILLILLLPSIALAIPCKVSDVGVSLIKEYEGLRQTAYWDHKSWAVGYGARGKGIGPNTWWTEVQATVVLEMELEELATKVCAARKIHTQGELDAFVSLAYNVGFFRIKRAGLFEERNLNILIGRWKQYVKASGKVLTGLKRRRLAEIRVLQGNAQDRALLLRKGVRP